MTSYKSKNIIASGNLTANRQKGFFKEKTTTKDEGDKTPFLFLLLLLIYNAELLILLTLFCIPVVVNVVKFFADFSGGYFGNGGEKFLPFLLFAAVNVYRLFAFFPMLF